MIRLLRLYAHNFKQLQEIELHFLERARVLVQGKNEAGKSTLFEAIFFALFGTALVTETGSRSLDDLIRYGIEKAEVQLDVQIGQSVLKITRRIVRDKSNAWELDIEEGGVVRDEIRGNAAVNKRLIDELGFDGDAMLNTCFVEQKKLEKLEGLSKSKREESLAKLLNLDALVDLEADFKISADDKRELERLRKRAELATVQAELPAREKELNAVEGKLKLIELRSAIDGATDELGVVSQLDAQIRTLTQRRDETAARVARLEQLREAMLSVKTALDAHERAEESNKEIERMRADLDETRRATQDTPKLQARARDLSRLSRHLERLDQIRTTRDHNAERVEKLASTQDRIVELRATVERAERSLEIIDARVREYEIGEALGQWIAAQGTPGRAMSVDAAQSNRDKISRRLQLETYALSGLLLAFLAAALLAQPFAVVFFALIALALIVLAFRVTTHWRALSHAAEELGQARALTNAGEAQIERAKETEARLAQLGVAIPETVDIAHSKRVMIAREMENKDGNALRVEQKAAQEKLLNARAVLGELQSQSQIDDRENVQAVRAASERTREKADRILSQWRERVAVIAQKLEVQAEAGAAQRALYQAQAQVEQIGKRGNDIAKLEKEIARRDEQARNFSARAREAFENARVLGNDSGVPIQPWNPSLTADDHSAFGKKLRAEYDSLGGENAVKQAREIEGELGRREGERKSRAGNANLLIERTRELASVLGGEISKTPTLNELQDLRARFEKIKMEDEATLRVRHREFVGRVHSLRDQQEELERELGLAGESLDRADCARELSEKERAMQVRERGASIMSVARRRIVQKVLPATMDYMRTILPTLTQDRYHDAQLDDETYKIQVWDERANSADGQGGSFKEKNIFSGGTKDQFSLALRLAFALATLPQERNTAPSFIFLDEPLGSFDDERAQALVYLLTEGEIAQAFDQIFLISHVRVDERLFTHRVLMEQGRVAFTDLPNGKATEGTELKEPRNKRGRK